jgi:hypothetical protein
MTTEEQETTPEVIEEAPEAEPTEPAGEPTAEAPEPDEDAVEDEVIVTVGDAPPPEAPAPEERDPKLVNKLRKLLREQERKVREYETKLKAAAPPVENAPPALGAKPKLEDLDYEADKYEAALAAWFERKRAHDEHAQKQKQAEEQQRQAWQARLDGYAKAKASLRVRDYEEAEHAVTDALDVTQQGIIVSGAENPALVTYALGKDSAKLAELRAITDPVKFAFAVAKLETQLKVTPRKPASAPETVVKSNTRVSGATDSVLERLEEEADRTGDRSRVVAYKAKLRAQAKK